MADFFDARQGVYLPKFGEAVLGGMKHSQDMRKGVLDMQKTQQDMQLGALKQQQEVKQQEAVAHARGAYNILNTQDKQGAYARYRQDMINSGYETPEEMPEQYTPEMDNTFKELIRGGQKFEDLTTTAQQDRQFGLDSEGFKSA